MTVMIGSKTLTEYMTEKLADRYEPASLSAFCEGLEEFVEDCIAKEREACAKLIEDRYSDVHGISAIAAAIRDRGPSPQEELPL